MKPGKKIRPDLRKKTRRPAVSDSRSGTFTAPVRKWGINGEGIVYHNGKVVFIDGAIPDEVVEYRITEEKPGYSVGSLQRIIKPSPRRRMPMCELQDICGGCSTMHMDYRGQVRMKESLLRQALSKYANWNGKLLPMLKNPSPLGYRNALKLPFGLDEEDRLATGMYMKGSNSFVALEHCLIHSPLLEKARREITRLASEAGLEPDRKSRKGGLTTLVLKEYDGQVHVVFVTGDTKLPSEFIEKVLQLEYIGGIWQSIRKNSDPEYEIFGDSMRHLGGQMDMHLELGDIVLSLQPRSFFQLNTSQAIRLYETVADWLQGAGTVVEAYSGVGAISLFIADQVDKVIGIELIEDAVSNARQNALLNGKENVTFICGDAGEEMKKLVRKEKIDAVIVDPPRKGLDEKMKKALIRSRAERIIYVSCNPSTLARDISDLSSHYRIVRVQPLDMFSQTSHVESITLLERKGNENEA